MVRTWPSTVEWTRPDKMQVKSASKTISYRHLAQPSQVVPYVSCHAMTPRKVRAGAARTLLSSASDFVTQTANNRMRTVPLNFCERGARRYRGTICVINGLSAG